MFCDNIIIVVLAANRRIIRLSGPVFNHLLGHLHSLHVNLRTRPHSVPRNSLPDSPPHNLHRVRQGYHLVHHPSSQHQNLQLHQPISRALNHHFTQRISHQMYRAFNHLHNQVCSLLIYPLLDHQVNPLQYHLFFQVLLLRINQVFIPVGSLHFILA